MHAPIAHSSYHIHSAYCFKIMFMGPLSQGALRTMIAGLLLFLLLQPIHPPCNLKHKCILNLKSFVNLIRSQKFTFLICKKRVFYQRIMIWGGFNL